MLFGAISVILVGVGLRMQLQTARKAPEAVYAAADTSAEPEADDDDDIQRM